MYVLRKYQRKAVDAAKESLTAKKQKNGILVLPTGSGKSIIIATITEELGGKTLILQPTKEILEQNRDKLRAIGCRNIGVYSASMNQKHVGTITLATIGSVVKKGFLFKEFDRIIIDECHKANSKEGIYSKFIDELDLPVLGLTATPYRMRNYRDFRTEMPVAVSTILTRTQPKIFKKIVHVTQIQELFDAGYLCPLDYDYLNTYDSAMIKSTTTGQGFNEESLRRYNKSKSIPAKIVDLVAETDKEHCLVFTQFTTESDIVVDGLRNQDIECVQVSALTKKADREYILSAFKAGRIKCVVNVGVLTTGFDFPELDCIILGRPTKSVALYYQMVGRGIRIHDNKDSCSLIDLCDNVKRFGKIKTFKLFDQNGKGMWRLKSSAGNLTGVNVITGKNLEKISIKAAPKLDDDGDECITFGIHNGMKLSKVPLTYIEWCSENMKYAAGKAVCKKELKRREKL